MHLFNFEIKVKKIVSDEKSVVYRITHRESGMFYLGSTSKLKVRIASHKATLRAGKHQNVHMNELMDHSRPVNDQFVFDVVERHNSAELALQRELYFINMHIDNPLLANILTSDGFGDALIRHPYKAEIIKRRVVTQRNAVAAMSKEEKRRRWSKPGKQNGMYGKTHTIAARQAISRANTGQSRNKGCKRSEAVKANLSLIASQRTGDKNPFYGRHHTVETRLILSQRNKGNKPANSRPIIADGNWYPSVTEAARQLGVTPGLICYRLRSPKYDYRYCNENSNDHPAGE